MSTLVGGNRNLVCPPPHEQPCWKTTILLWRMLNLFCWICIFWHQRGSCLVLAEDFCGCQGYQLQVGKYLEILRVEPEEKTVWGGEGLWWDIMPQTPLFKVAIFSRTDLCHLEILYSRKSQATLVDRKVIFINTSSHCRSLTPLSYHSCGFTIPQEQHWGYILVCSRNGKASKSCFADFKSLLSIGTASAPSELA